MSRCATTTRPRIPRNPIDPPRRALWGEQSFDEMGTVGFSFEVLHKPDVPAFQAALAARNKAAIAAGGQNGTLGRFLARQQRQNRGLAAADGLRPAGDRREPGG